MLPGGTSSILLEYPLSGVRSLPKPMLRLPQRPCPSLQGIRDIGAYLGLVPRRYESGEVDYTDSISKCSDRRVWTLLYEAANVILTHYKPALKLKDWAWAEQRWYRNLSL